MELKEELCCLPNFFPKYSNAARTVALSDPSVFGVKSYAAPLWFLGFNLIHVFETWLFHSAFEILSVNRDLKWMWGDLYPTCLALKMWILPALTWIHSPELQVSFLPSRTIKPLGHGCCNIFRTQAQTWKPLFKKCFLFLRCRYLLPGWRRMDL